MVESVTVPSIYHRFIAGPYGRTLRRLMKETKTTICLPPMTSHFSADDRQRCDVITVTGRSRGLVSRAVGAIAAMHEREASIENQ